jgi:adenylate kinase
MVTILLTGTPGTGKTTVAKILSTSAGYKVLSINDLVGDDFLYLEDGVKVVEPDALTKKIKSKIVGDCVIEGHLSHLLDVQGTVIVLRTHPKELEKRLIKKGYSTGKIRENIEAEALDICLIESVEDKNEVYEIDTTSKNPDAVTKIILGILEGDNENYKPGKTSWLEEYLNLF